MKRRSHILCQVRKTLEAKGYAQQTIKNYTDWIFRFIFYNHKRDPIVMGEKEINSFLNFLQNESKLSLSSQSQALNAVCFLYKDVLGIPLGKLKTIKVEKMVNNALCQQEIRQILTHLYGETRLMASLLYGCGLQLSECLSLRIKDVNFEFNRICVISKIKNESREVTIPNCLRNNLKIQIENVKTRWKKNILLPGLAGTLLTKFDAPSNKYTETKDFKWQFVFPSNSIKINPNTGNFVQPHRDRSSFQKSLKKAIKE